MGRGHLGLLRWKPSKLKQNRFKQKSISEIPGVLISPRWVVTAGLKNFTFERILNEIACWLNDMCNCPIDQQLD